MNGYHCGVELEVEERKGRSELRHDAKEGEIRTNSD